MTVEISILDLHGRLEPDAKVFLVTGLLPSGWGFKTVRPLSPDRFNVEDRQLGWLARLRLSLYPPEVGKSHAVGHAVGQ